MDIGAWLRGLGLDQYEAAFRGNEIDGDILPKLTVDDLRDLGIAAVGHRRKIVTAIEAINAVAAEPAATEAAPAPVSAADAAERRQLTVMFCDLVGSTALSARLDPEDMRRVIRAYQDAVSGVVARYDGFVAKFMGDGVLSYFGFPRAHEDDAERAVHAGLEIAEVVAGLETPAPGRLAARIGAATGLVVVGDIVGQGAAKEQAVVGDTPNLAARLQGLADAGGVVISSATRRLIGDAFRLKDLGKHVVKGLAEPVEAFAALGIAATESRFEAAHTSRLTGFVGRDAEAADLLARQRRAWDGRGQIVLISGEAGIGKSRISAWIAEQVAQTPHTRLRYQCSPYHRDSALYPFAQQFERAAGFAAQDGAEAKLDKLEKLLALATDRLDEFAPLISAMLSIPTGTRYAKQNLSPAQQRRQTLFALLDQMEGLAKRQPILMLFEDAHWADATSLEVLDLAIERMRKLPVLLLITHRPEFTAPWKGLPDVAEIALGRLEPAQAEALVGQVTGGRKLPAEVLAQIVAKTDGVPLFVEELTKNVLESGLLVEEADHYRLDGPLPPLAIPSTLQDSLMARLDRLAAVKEVAQIGAAIGREFSFALLQAVVGRDEATLRASLAQLEESELVFRAGEPPAARYTFKHALVQDTAYESLLKSRRQILHRRIAEVLHDNFPEVIEAEPELIAEHYTRAGLTEPAIVHWGKAGDLALRRSAFKEAIAHLGKAIEMTEAGAGEKEGAGRKLKLNLALSNALTFARGYAAPETAVAFARARELAEAAGETADHRAIAYGEWRGCFVRGELQAMREHAARFTRNLGGNPKSLNAWVAHRVNGMTHWYAGEYSEARESFDRALAASEPKHENDTSNRFLGGAASAMGYQALVLWALGETEVARLAADRVVENLDGFSHMGSVAVARLNAALFEMLRGDPDRAASHSKALAKVIAEHDLGNWQALSAWLKNWTLWRSRELDTGRERLREGRFAALTVLGGPYVPLIAISIAEADIEAGDYASALSAIDFNLSKNQTFGRLNFQAEAFRTRGNILLKQTPADPAPAEAAFLAAIAIAQSQKARSFELRAALALAKLYQSTNRPLEALDVLRPALEGFSPTPEFAKIGEAQTLLSSLTEHPRVRAQTEGRDQSLRIHTGYAQAMMAVKGYAAEETRRAYARVGALATASAAEHWTNLNGQWANLAFLGELGEAHRVAETFVREAEAANLPVEAATGRRLLGATKAFRGELAEAIPILDEALAAYSPHWPPSSPAYGDFLCDTLALSAIPRWQAGDVDTAAARQSQAIARAKDIGHGLSLAVAIANRLSFSAAVGRADLVHRLALDLRALSQEHGIGLWGVVAEIYLHWARDRLGHADALAELQTAVKAYDQTGGQMLRPQHCMLLAEREIVRGDQAAALATLAVGIHVVARTGQRPWDSALLRLRGDALTASDPAAAEASYIEALTAARETRARTFELLAAHALAKHLRTTSRPVEAHDILGPALEGFSPTPEFAEIAEAKALFEALAEDSAVVAEKARRERRLQLQLNLGQATVWSEGFAADATQAAFARAAEIAATTGNLSQRFAASHGLWTAAFVRGELTAARELAQSFLDQAQAAGRVVEAGVASRGLALICYCAGDFAAAQTHAERALQACGPGRDEEARQISGEDTGTVAMCALAVTAWQTGEVSRAREWIDAANRRAEELDHAASKSMPLSWWCALEILRGDALAALTAALALDTHAQKYGLRLFSATAELNSAWARGRLYDPAAGVRELGGIFEAFAATGSRSFRDAYYQGLLAELQAQTLDFEGALARVDAALTQVGDVGCDLGFLHRLRGEILSARDPADPRAEDALRTALEVTRRQGARSQGLRAALALAKLYQSTDRAIEARAVLGPALDGFSPTPEFAEIADAQALLSELGIAAQSRKADL